MASIDEIQKVAIQLRRDVLRMVHAVNSGHPGAPLGCAEFLSCLFCEIMHHNPKTFNMDGVGEDMFFLSNGHLSAGLYSILARTGYFDVKELATFRKLNSRLQGHPATAEHLPGIRIASGSLGQGLSVAVGAAIAKKLNNDNKTIYVLMGDGEIQEGQIWEAAMFAGAKKIDNIIATVDWNGQQIDGPVNDVLNLGDLEAKWKSFGWQVLHMNGNNVSQILQTIKQAKGDLGKGMPIVILMKTEMGYGVDFMVGTHKWHGSAPNDDQLQKALSQLPETLGDY